MASSVPYDFGYKPVAPYAAPVEGPSAVRRLTNQIFSPLTSPLISLKSSFDDWRRSNGYEERPGLLEDITRPIKNVHASAFLFDGAKADLQKTISINPIFQVSHAFTVGSTSQGPSGAAGTYNFSAVRGTDSSLMTGAIDGDGSLQGRANYAWTPGADDAISKCQFQIASGAMANSVFIFQQDFNGPGYNTSLKMINPSITDGTGSASLSTLYSITRGLSLGAEVLGQRTPFQGAKNALATEVGFQAAAKYTGKDWSGILQVTPTGATSLSYLHRLNERVEAAADLQLVPSLQPRARQAVATLGVKYDYRPATFRGQIDSTGKVAAFLEQRLNPIMSFLLSAEIDHAKNTSKFGVGFQLDTATIDEQVAANATPVKVPT